MLTLMHCACCANGVRLASPGRDFTIEVEGRRHEFEMHPYFGPAVLDKNGDPAKRQPGPRHPFWTAVTLWSQQGKHVGADGLCVWAPEQKPALVHLGGRHYTLKGGALDPKRGEPAC